MLVVWVQRVGRPDPRPRTPAVAVVPTAGGARDASEVSVWDHVREASVSDYAREVSVWDHASEVSVSDYAKEVSVWDHVSGERGEVRTQWGPRRGE